MARSAHGRPSFARTRRSRTREAGQELAGSYEFWFRRKYSLAPTDPRFLAMTIDDIQTEWWAHQFADNPNLDIVEDDEFDADAELARINAAAEAGPGPLPDDFEEIP